MAIKIRSYPLTEVFQMVAEHPGTIAERAEMLQKMKCKEMLWIVDFIYNHKDFPVPVPEFKRSIYPHDNNFMSLRTSIVTLNKALSLVNKDEKQYNRLMRKVLENISGEESDLLVHVFQGKKIEGISKAVFKRAFPEFFPDDVAQDQDGAAE